jgi:superfamily II DNA/RNA helicase
VPARKKRDVLRQILQSENVQTGIIFCNRKTTVREINKSLNSYGFSSGEIHGDMDQGSRIAELQRFKDGKINILVASDVAARGLDVKGVSHVFNFDTPWHPDDYVHRIGRTGRAGALGRAFTFVAPEDAEAIQNVEKLTGGPIPVYDLGGTADAGSEAAAETAQPEKQEREPRQKREGKPREPRQAREPRAERTPREDRSRARREDTSQEQVPEPAVAAPREADAPVQARAERAPRRDTAVAEPRQERRPRRGEQDGPDDGWNGPVPDFLKASALN